MGAFSDIASHYDLHFSHSPTGRYQRARVHAFLQGILPHRESWKILELNAGTGEDAVWLGKQGHRVIATDKENGMLGFMKSKITSQALHAHVFVRALDLNDIGAAQSWGKFQLVFSNFGGINCLNPVEITQFGRALHELLPGGGHLVAVVMGRRCLWESLYFLAKGRWKQARRRWGGGPVMARVGPGEIPTWYYSPAHLRRAWQPLAVNRIYPVGFSLPPSYLDPFFQGRPNWLKRLAAWENRYFSHSGLASWSDHFLIHLQKPS